MWWYKMLETPLGPIFVELNDKPVAYQAAPLNLVFIGTQGLPVFDVEGRYRIRIDRLPACAVVVCRFAPAKEHPSCISSGERLALKTWNDGPIEFSIGTEDEIPGTKIEYLANGLKVAVSRHSDVGAVTFQIAWLTVRDVEKESNYTWFAADPTI